MININSEVGKGTEVVIRIPTRQIKQSSPEIVEEIDLVKNTKE